LSAYLLATLRKNFQTDLHEIYREGWQWANEQKGKFWRRFGSVIRIRIRIRISTLVRRALAEVCAVPVLLVYKYSTAILLFFSEMEANVSELVVKELTSSPATIRDTEVCEHCSLWMFAVCMQQRRNLAQIAKMLRPITFRRRKCLTAYMHCDSQKTWQYIYDHNSGKS